VFELDQIASFYPENIRGFKRNILREYLQYKVLEIVFDSKFGSNLAFMGGTAVHMIYQNDRFSEDLDFDNLGLSETDFEELSLVIQNNLKLEGYSSEFRNKFTGAFQSQIKCLNVLFENGLSSQRNEKLLIGLDTEPQGFEYEPDKPLLNKFDVFLKINVIPIDILLSQKICAVFKRRRTMGRDFYDIVFLMGRTKPNLDYLRLKFNINSFSELKNRLIDKCHNLDFEQLARDVQPFLFNPSNSKKVLNFYDYIEQYQFD